MVCHIVPVRQSTYLIGNSLFSVFDYVTEKNELYEHVVGFYKLDNTKANKIVYSALKDCFAYLLLICI